MKIKKEREGKREKEGKTGIHERGSNEMNVRSHEINAGRNEKEGRGKRTWVPLDNTDGRRRGAGP